MFAKITRMNVIRPLILAIGVTVCLIVLLFPPLRCPSAYLEQPKLVGASIGGHFEAVEAVHIPRFSGFYGPSLSHLKSGAVVQTEIDAGELLRELAFIVLLSGAVYRWLPALLKRAWQESVGVKSGALQP